MKRKIYVLLNVLLLVGMFLSIFLIYEHFSVGSSDFCNIAEGFDCGIVNKSPYANLDGIFYLMTIDFGWNTPLINISDVNVIFDVITSNAFLGFLTLLFSFLLVRANYQKKKIFGINKEINLRWLRGIFLFSVFYGIYLFYIQHFILKTYCILCLGLDLILITTLIVLLKVKDDKK